MPQEGVVLEYASTGQKQDNVHGKRAVVSHEQPFG